MRLLSSLFLLFACASLACADPLGPADVEALKLVEMHVEEALRDTILPPVLEDAHGPLDDSPDYQGGVRTPSLLLGDVRTTPPISTPGPEIPDSVEADEPVVVPT
jgi:hypothetical protein